MIPPQELKEDNVQIGIAILTKIVENGLQKLAFRWNGPLSGE